MTALPLPPPRDNSSDQANRLPIDVLSIHVPLPRQCLLFSTRPLPQSTFREATTVVERILHMLDLPFQHAGTLDRLRRQPWCDSDLSRATLFVPDHDLMIEVDADRTKLASSNILVITNAEDAWDLMRLIAAHCDVEMPQFSFAAI